MPMNMNTAKITGWVVVDDTITAEFSRGGVEDRVVHGAPCVRVLRMPIDPLSEWDKMA
jgi:hypothetical protein